MARLHDSANLSCLNATLDRTRLPLGTGGAACIDGWLRAHRPMPLRT